MQQPPKPYALEMPGALGESCLQARVLFLESVVRIRPHVVTDLWDTALPDFKWAVLRHFREQIFEGISDLEEYIAEKCKESFEAQDSFENARLLRKLETVALQWQSGGATDDLAESHKRVIEEHVKAFHDRLLLDLLQSKLEPAIMEPHPIRMEFFGWHSIVEKLEYETLSARLRQWSARWNLDANWCRDHALAVLREWLLDRNLKWMDPYFHPSAPTVQAHGWTLATNEVEFSRLSSRVEVDCAVHGVPDKPAVLKTRWLGCYSLPAPQDYEKCFCLSFESFWNTAKESEPDFKRRAHLDFRIALAEVEAIWLKQMKEEEKLYSSNSKEFEKKLAWRKGALEKFEEDLKEYVAKMKNKRQAAKSEHSLVEGGPTPQNENLTTEWLIQYQVPQDGDCLSYQDIEKAQNVTTYSRDYLRKVVESRAKLIALPLRDPRLHAGRPEGSGGIKARKAAR
jgi:hypothetical protein